MHEAEMEKFILSSTHKRTLVILMLIGVVGLLIGWAVNPERAWTNFLIDSFYFLTLALSGVFFAAIQYVSGSRWSEALRRLPEAIMSYLPIAGVFMLILFFGMQTLYHWTGAGTELHGKATYLNEAFFFARQIGIIALWSGFAWLMRRNSIQQDNTGEFCYYKRNVRLSAIFIIVFAFSFSFASYDWIMSLEPHWFSTIFAAYNFSGMFVNGIVVITLMTIVLKEHGYLKGINENHYHDLGKLIFAFTMFWAYIWFCQLLLIWYSNIPEETVYYVTRLKNDWDWLFFTNFAINFVVPFFVLVPRSSKRSASLLKRICIVLLVGRWLDLYLLITPGVNELGIAIGLIEVAIALGFAGLFVFCVATALSKRPLLPMHSPLLHESLHHHQ